MLNLMDRRAIKITQLSEELDTAKQMICDLIYKSDMNKEQHEKFLIRCAKFAGCATPKFNVCNEEESTGG